MRAMNPDSLMDRMGIEVVEATAERLVATMPVAGNTQPYGLLHGGASVVLAETLGSIGAALHAGPGQGRRRPRHQRDPPPGRALGPGHRHGDAAQPGPHAGLLRGRRHRRGRAGASAPAGSPASSGMPPRAPEQRRPASGGRAVRPGVEGAAKARLRSDRRRRSSSCPVSTLSGASLRRSWLVDTTRRTMTEEKPSRAKNRLASRLRRRHVRHDELAARALGARQHGGDEGLGDPVPAGVRPDPELLDGELGLRAQAEGVLGGDRVADGLAVEPGHERLDPGSAQGGAAAARR